MTIYTVHLPPDVTSADEVAERAVFVKEGFAFFGFAFTGFWLLAQRLWLETLAYLAALVLVSAIFWYFGLPRGAYAGITFLFSLLIGSRATNGSVAASHGLTGARRALSAVLRSMNASGASSRTGRPARRPAPRLRL